MTVKNAIFGLIIAVAFLLAFLLGYNISAKTGVEPGFFQAPGAAGYGAGTEGKAPVGMDKDLMQHYKDLQK